jgi:hypothetical protein
VEITPRKKYPSNQTRLEEGEGIIIEYRQCPVFQIVREVLEKLLGASSSKKVAR